MLIEHMTEGYSYESFGALVDVHVDTLYEWEKRNKEFSDAKKRGVLKSLLWHERMLKTCMVNKRANATPLIYKMKCKFPKFGYNPRNEVEAGDDDVDLEFV